jgi:hypothetical protein
MQSQNISLRAVAPAGLGKWPQRSALAQNLRLKYVAPKNYVPNYVTAFTKLPKVA